MVASALSAGWGRSYRGQPYGGIPIPLLEKLLEIHTRAQTGEDTRTPTDDVATISIDIVAEAYTWREERTDRRQVVIRDTVFLSYSRAIEVGVSRRTVEEEGHIDTQTVSQAEVIGSLPPHPERRSPADQRGSGEPSERRPCERRQQQSSRKT